MKGRLTRTLPVRIAWLAQSAPWGGSCQGSQLWLPLRCWGRRVPSALLRGVVTAMGWEPRTAAVGWWPCSAAWGGYSDGVGAQDSSCQLVALLCGMGCLR